MTETTNQTAKYSKNYSGDVGETPKPMTGTWHLEAPDGRRWSGSGPLNCVAQEISERVPVQVQLARVLAIADEPYLDERHAKLGVEYGTVKVDELVDKLQAERDELRAKLDELARQEHAAFVNEQGFIIERDDMQISSGEKLYLAAGARPVEPVQKLRPDFIAGYDAGMADAKRIQAHQPAPAAQDDEKDAARLYPVVIDGLLWLCTKRGGTFKPVDDCAAVNPPLSWKNALAADKKEPT